MSRPATSASCGSGRTRWSPAATRTRRRGRARARSREDALYRRIRALADQVEDPANAIFNLHVPPYGSGLDTANEVNPDQTLRYVSGQPNPIPVGSTAVRQLLEEFQPLLALHGHIHESRGEVRIGRTLAINTGSEYNSGHIHGAVVTLADHEVPKHQFVVG